MPDGVVVQVRISLSAMQTEMPPFLALLRPSVAVLPIKNENYVSSVLIKKCVSKIQKDS